MHVTEFQDAISSASQVDLRVVADDTRTFNASMRSHSVGRISLSDIECGPAIIERYSQGEDGRRFFVMVQLAGTGTVRYGSNEFHMVPGDFFLADSSHCYQNIFQSRVRRLVVRMDRAELLSRLPHHKALCGTRVNGERGAARLFADMIQGLASEAPDLDLHARAYLGSRTLDVLALALGYHGNGDTGAPQSRSRLAIRDRILTYLQENLHNPLLDTNLIAQAMKISPRYVQNIFESTGTTVRDLIRERRLQQCYERLLDRRRDHMTVSEIAFDAGFNSFEHFCRCFKARFGMTSNSLRRTRPS